MLFGEDKPRLALKFKPWYSIQRVVYCQSSFFSSVYEEAGGEAGRGA
jgi:hypothetical protein